MNTMTLTFIGAGHMAEALIHGILNAKLFSSSNVRVADIDSQRLTCMKTQFHVAGFHTNAEAVAGADMVILAVKPNVVPDVLAELKNSIPRKALILSIAAGITTAFIEARLNPGARVIRVMPNTAARVSKGVAALCGGSRATEADAQQAESLFRAVGIVVRVKEDDMDAVTALSGNGPAYVFYLVESMQAAASKLGLDPATTLALAIATVEGAAHLMAETGLEPEALRRRVTSKGGTTEAAFKVLEEHRVLESFVAAMHKAHQRSRELSK